MKKIITSFLIVLLACICVSPKSVNAEDDITTTLTYKINPKITWELDGGKSDILPPEVEYDTVLQKPSVDPTKDGCVFDGWYIDPERKVKYTFTEKVTSNITIYAKWIEEEYRFVPEESTIKWTKGSTGEASMVFKAVIDDKHTFERYENSKTIKVDGTTIKEGIDYTAEPGSLIIYLKDLYLNNLEKGNHTIQATFKDNTSEKVAIGNFTVVESEPSPTTPTYLIPKTSVTWLIKNGPTVLKNTEIPKDVLITANVKTFVITIVPAENTMELVKLKSSENNFKFINGSDSIEYSLKNNDTVYNVDSPALTSTTTITVEFNVPANSKPGVYTDTLTFSVHSVKKGDLINLKEDGTNDVTFRVLKIDGSNAMLLRMDNYGGDLRFGTSRQYKDGILDEKLNDDYYSTLSDEIRNAIGEGTDITQNYYRPVSGSSSQAIYHGVNKSGDNYGFALSNDDQIGKRFVFALDVADIAEYLSPEGFTPENLNKLFFDRETMSQHFYIWTRSSYHEGSYIWAVSTQYGSIVNRKYNDSGTFYARPAFNIDLTKVSFTKAD